MAECAELISGYVWVGGTNFWPNGEPLTVTGRETLEFHQKMPNSFGELSDPKLALYRVKTKSGEQTLKTSCFHSCRDHTFFKLGMFTEKMVYFMITLMIAGVEESATPQMPKTWLNIPWILKR